MDPKIEVSIVPTEHIDTFWRQIEPLLKPAADRSHGRYLVEDIYDSIIQYDSQCWVAHHSGIIVGAAVSHQVFYPRKTVLVVAFCKIAQTHFYHSWLYFGSNEFFCL